MGLEQYKQKRDFSKTTEPKAGRGKDQNSLRFVVQKHDASHLHYDFRLEMEGVLKSWAVPKGPSTNPEIKRLAVMVEDHPYDYKDFEGIIPKGQYGGGTVIVWDEGTYQTAEKVIGDEKKQEKALLQQLEAGKLKIKLKGKKLKGEFALVKAHGRGENDWLLMKLQDRYASEADITLKDKSVLSKKTIQQMEQRPVQTYAKPTGKANSAKPEKKAPRTKTKQLAELPLEENATELKESELKALLKNAPKQAFYQSLSPMLATLVDQAFDDDNWCYEIKWDGYRAVALMNKTKFEFKSRNGKSFAEKFYPIADALKKMKLNAVFDGEVVVLNRNGQANFGKLQNWRSEADGELIYYVFDLLWYNGKDLKGLPLLQRKAILQAILPTNESIQLSKDFETSGIEFLEVAKKMGLEGIMAKKKNSGYHPKERSKDWLKIKANKRQEVVIAGFTRNADTKKVFSSLLVGVYKGAKLIYIGKIGTGFSNQMQQAMMKQFKPLITNQMLFAQAPEVNKASRFKPNPNAVVTWLKPLLVAEVSYTEMTADGVMRHPAFEGLREDKSVKSIVLEKEKASESIVKGSKRRSQSLEKSSQKQLLNSTENIQIKKVNGHELKLTNLNKIYWPKEKISKRDLINYYHQIAPVLLPYLKNRPQSMNRYPNGITGKSFYFKNVKGKVPDWMSTYAYFSEDDAQEKEYLIANDEATLLYMINMGCIELNPWSSTVKKPDHPTFCMIDLDPDQNSFDQVVETALLTKQLLDDMGVPSYCKTSGSTGLHIYIPLNHKYAYEQSKEFARVIVTLVNKELPKFTTLERTIKDRKGKMYLDFLQNRAHATIACAYAVRPKPGATVSMPLEWDEVKKGLKMTDFTIHNALERIQTNGDIFKPVLGKGVDLEKVIVKYMKKQ